MSHVRRVRAVLRGRTLGELGDRARQAGRAALERAGLSRDTAPEDESAWRGELHRDGGMPYADAQDALAEFRAKAPSRFFAGTANIPATIAAIRSADPGVYARTLELAQAAASGSHRLLGFGALDYGTPTDWHFDPVRSRRAPLTHWSQVAYLDEEAVGDHKVIWEVNRHQWLLHLAKAWHLTGDNAWAERTFAQIDAWIAANPGKRGINWASSLEIALRAISWLWVIYLLRDSPALTAQRLARIIRVLAVSGRHVEHHLSTWFSPNTHLTGEALGLLYIGCALPELKDAPRWRRAGMAILAERMPDHVRPDGTYVEQSTHYARYTLDFLIHASALARRSGVEVPPTVDEALPRAARFLRHVTRPDGTIPLIGDDDGGRVLFLDPAAPNDVRPTLCAAAVLAGDPALAGFGGFVSEEVAWLLGPAALGATPPTGQRPDASRFFPDGGFATLRDGWDASASLGVLDCGPHGMGNGGHAHADLGSVDLTLRGRPVVADPGTWSYLAEDGGRDSFRGALAHAAALVDGEGSAQPGTQFAWMRVPQVLGRVARLSPECDIVAFSHDGFLHLPDPVAHRRALLRVRRDYWLFIDTFKGREPHEALISYPLAAGLHAELEGSHALIRDPAGEVARFESTVHAAPWYLASAWTSRAYGQREPAVRLAQRWRFEGEFTAVALVQAAGDAPIVMHVDGAIPDQVRIERTNGMCDLLQLGGESGSLIARSGHRVEWAWPPLSFGRSNGRAG